MSDYYRNSHLHPDKGISYEKSFHAIAYRSLLWEIERRVLDLIIQDFYKGKVINHLDFACGTGRILTYLQDRVDISVGVDVSESMLSVARVRQLSPQLIKADITRDDVLEGRKFNLITAFRFFANAEPELKRQSMEKLVQCLSPQGYIVFNNHRNLSNLLNCLRRWLKRGGTNGMLQNEVDNLLDHVGLVIEKVYHIGLLPSDQSQMPLPRVIMRAIELLAFKIPFLQRFAHNLIFVCRLANNANQNDLLSHIIGSQ